MSMLRTVVILTFTVSALYFLFRAYSSIRRVRSIGYFHHYRLFMPTAGLLVSSGAAWAFAFPQLWYLPVVALVSGLLLALREVVWAIRSFAVRITAEHALVKERRRFRDHDEDDRKLLTQLQQNLESAGFASKARRFRDTHRSASRLLEKLKLLQQKRSHHPENPTNG